MKLEVENDLAKIHREMEIYVNHKMEFGFVVFNHYERLNSSFIEKPHSLEIYYKNGAVKNYEYFFSFQVLIKLVAENFNYIFKKMPLP